MTALLAGARLGTGARFAVSVTKANTIGGIWQFTTRAGKAPPTARAAFSPAPHSPISAAGPRLNGHADVAQLVEHFTRNEGVPGSSPGVGSRFSGI